MIQSPLFSKLQMVPLMQKLYVAMDAVCQSTGDISLGEYALLASVAEVDSGFPLKEIRVDFERFDNPNYYVELLENKELITRIRNRADLRGYALKVSPKGRARISLLDESIASALISAHETWTEDEFELFISKAHALAHITYPTRRTSTIFPAVFISLVHKYHQLILRIAAYYGMTSLQIALLSTAKEESLSIALSSDLHTPLAADSIVEIQLHDLMSKDIILQDEIIELTEKGQKRLDEFAKHLSHHANNLFAHFPLESESALEELGEYCIYLFE